MVPAPTPAEMRNCLLPLETAVFSGTSALQAQNLGADRVELNAPGSYPQGGTTPPLRDLLAVKHNLEIPIRIMIRPRGPPSDGSPDFIYSDVEFEQMRQAIRDFKAADVLNPIAGDGFVFGVLKYRDLDNIETPLERVTIDKERCKELIELARPLPCIFHRAFDTIAGSSRWEEGVEDLKDCGFEAVLTSGGQGNCADNMDRLEQMCRRIGKDLQLIVGGGLRPHNVESIASRLSTYLEVGVYLHTGAIRLHTDGRTPVSDHVDAELLGDTVAALGVAVPD
ncbi:copper homeostasis CutC domain-containing protein [Stachybotrys elegans]|uniref:Copper homeostasis protein cutC homolog n=1 Tax=Stachybotrys elegans TaxID=80388 RepID=A0A8K0ST47_9HYPO|nr:copper homeostasis CutC domain-containing protein [Stachybotrys elegans]